MFAALWQVDYYKIRCNNDFHIVIPQNFSKKTSDYLDKITKRHNFTARDGFILHDDLRLFDVRAPQPEIDLYVTCRTLHYSSPASLPQRYQHVVLSGDQKWWSTTD